MHEHEWLQVRAYVVPTHWECVSHTHLPAGNHQTAPQPARSSISTPSCKPLIDERLADLCSGDPHCTPSQYLSQLVAKMLLQSLEPGKAPLLQRIQTLQRAGLDIETLYPQVCGAVQVGRSWIRVS